jgi:nitrite reductase/ring-hydroxylating ferredoxin subunit
MMDQAQTEQEQQEQGLAGRWPRYEAAAAGFRHYWYPVLESRKLGKRPRALTVLGEKIVLVRGHGKAHALRDRCPHRGVPLSAGRCEFDGTLTCAYHGWTFDLATGDLVAALTDGPDSPICGTDAVRVPTDPVAERAGLIWVYVGDAPHPPVEDDIPEELLRADAVVEPMVERRPGNWRYAMENAVDEAHAKYFHRRTPFYLFSKFPGYQTDTRMIPSEDGLWLRRVSNPVFEPAEYPRVGKWPRRDFWRWRGGGVREDAGSGVVIMGGARLPGIFSVGHEDWTDFQIFVPVDADHHLALQVSMRETRGLGKLLWRLRYWSYIRYIHHVLLNRREDGFIVAVTDSPPEQLFRPDISIVGWRRWCEEKARRSPAETRIADTVR